MNKWRRLHRQKQARIMARRVKMFGALRAASVAAAAAAALAHIQMIRSSRGDPTTRSIVVSHAVAIAVRNVTAAGERFRP